jgi:hypothetical protein
VIALHCKNKDICLEYLIITASIAQYEMTLFDEDEEDDKPVDELVKNLKEMKNFHNVCFLLSFLLNALKNRMTNPLWKHFPNALLTYRLRFWMILYLIDF